MMPILPKLLDILPTAIASRAFGAICDIPLPSKLQAQVNRAFSKIVGIQTDEANAPIATYPSLSALFTRSLKPGRREISDADVIAPVDGKLSFMGKVTNGTILEAKGRAYCVDQLVGSSQHLSWLENAYAFTIYLSPRDYHRIHAPISGKITELSYVPGRLLPVNRLGYWLTDDLLPQNERLTSWMQRQDGRRCALVKVGATCVGKIRVCFDTFEANTFQRQGFVRPLVPPFAIQSGDEIASFDLGSTVVLFVEGQGFTPNPDLICGQTVRLGMPLGQWCSESSDALSSRG